MPCKVVSDNANIVPASRQCYCFGIAASCFKQDYRIIAAGNPKHLRCSLGNLQVAGNRNIFAIFTLDRSSAKEIFCFRKILIICSISPGITIIPICPIPFQWKSLVSAVFPADWTTLLYWSRISSFEHPTSVKLNTKALTERKRKHFFYNTYHQPFCYF